jgi:hypothetical protein
VHVPVAHKLWPRLCQSVKYLLVGCTALSRSRAYVVVDV